MKYGTGIYSKIKKKIKDTGKISRSEAVEIARQTLYRALAIRYSPKGKRRSEENGFKRSVADVFFYLTKRGCKYAEKLGVKSDGNGGLICENWQNPKNLGIEEGIISVPKPDIRGEVPSQGNVASASRDLHPSGKRKRGRPSGTVRLPSQADACDSTELT
jgi:hypothetical protein